MAIDVDANDVDANDVDELIIIGVVNVFFV